MDNADSPPRHRVTYRFGTIGPIVAADLEPGELTIVAGHNNTGKTYIVYALYGFLKMWRHAFRTLQYTDAFLENQDQFFDIPTIFERLIKEGRVEHSLDNEMLIRHRELLLQQLAASFSKEFLPEVFSTRADALEDASLEIALGEGSHLDRSPFRGMYVEGSYFAIEYTGTNFTLVIGYDKESGIPEFDQYIASNYLSFLFRGLFPEPFLLSSERFGISLFYRDLDFAKSQLVDMLQKLGDKNRGGRRAWRRGLRGDVFAFPFWEHTSRYALPIKDNIDYTRSIPDLQGTRSDLCQDKLFDGIKDMMSGYYGNSGDDIRFISKARGKGRSFNIPLHLASSSARGLSDLYFFLRHVAKKDQLLIIDEPESHLDTANQILLARLLARLVRAGLSVLVTTHSDYLIKEVNNLVMLSSPFPQRDSVRRSLKYQEDDFLKPDSIRAYVAEKSGLRRCDVDRFGIDMPVFDQTIDGINRVSNELSSRLMDQPEA